MCAAVPSMPAVLIVPLTELAPAIEIVPVPDADVVTGGVSSAPVKVTFESTANTDPPNARAAAATNARIHAMLSDVLMIGSPGLCVERWNCYFAPVNDGRQLEPVGARLSEAFPTGTLGGSSAFTV